VAATPYPPPRAWPTPSPGASTLPPFGLSRCRPLTGSLSFSRIGVAVGTGLPLVPLPRPPLTPRRVARTALRSTTSPRSPTSTRAGTQPFCALRARMGQRGSTDPSILQARSRGRPSTLWACWTERVPSGCRRWRHDGAAWEGPGGSGGRTRFNARSPPEHTTLQSICYAAETATRNTHRAIRDGYGPVSDDRRDEGFVALESLRFWESFPLAELCHSVSEE